MIELTGILKYKEFPSHWDDSKLIEKELKIFFPENKGIVLNDKGHLVISNTYLAEKTLKEIFFESNLNVSFKNHYYYEFQYAILYGVEIIIKDEKDVKRFLRKYRIANLLYEA